MSETKYELHFSEDDTAPGDEQGMEEAKWGGAIPYLVGFGLATVLTGVSFFLSRSSGLVWAPSIPVALAVLAIAQMGVHLVFFLHLTTTEDNINNIMALMFGLLIVFLIVAGSLWIMYHLDHNMVPMEKVMQMQR